MQTRKKTEIGKVESKENKGKYRRISVVENLKIDEQPAKTQKLHSRRPDPRAKCEKGGLTSANTEKPEIAQDENKQNNRTYPQNLEWENLKMTGGP